MNYACLPWIEDQGLMELAKLKYKRFKLRGGQAYYRWSDWAAVIAKAEEEEA